MKTKYKHSIIDIKSLPEKERVKIRLKLLACFEQGMTKYRAAIECRVQERTVGRIFERFKEVGKDAVYEEKRGPKAGSEKCKLSEEQLKKMKRDVTDKTPDQLKFAFALWSSKAIKEYVLEHFGVTISRRTARRYMQRMGFTYQCPIKRAREQNSEQVENWLNVEYPKIRKQAKDASATILWGDEATIMTGETKARGYSPKGISPILRAPVNHSIRCNMISAISNVGELHFMIFEGAMNVDLFKDFLKRLMKDFSNPVFLIVDNLKVHHAKCLKPWLEEYQEKLRLFFLPSYSPELNPDEYLNRDVKANLAEKNLPKSKEGLRKDVETHLNIRKNDTESVKRLFHKKEVQYAAEEEF